MAKKVEWKAGKASWMDILDIPVQFAGFTGGFKQNNIILVV
jgi:hypothetical protein